MRSFLSSLLVASFVLVFAIWGEATTDVLLSLENGRIKVGEEIVLNLILVKAPQGLQRYEITVFVKDSTVAKIRDVKGVVIGDPFFQVISQTEDSIRFRALDLENRIQPGAENVVLASLTFMGVKGGQTELGIEINAFVDDEGKELKPTVKPGMLEVEMVKEEEKKEEEKEVEVPPPQAPPRIGDLPNLPQDLNGDGLYEDINGDGLLTPEDVAFFTFYINSKEIQENVKFFDFDGDGDVDFDDAIKLASLIKAPVEPTVTTIHLESKRVRPGEEVELGIILIQAPKGLQKYSVVISLTDEAVARIKGVESVAIDKRFLQVVRQTNSSIEFRVADFKDEVKAGVKHLTLATLTLEGVKQGRTMLEIKIKVMTDDEGKSIKPTVQYGELKVITYLAPLEEGVESPQDLDGDGLYEDTDGDGVLTFKDAITLAFNLKSRTVLENPKAFDFDGDGDVDFDDAAALAFLVEKP
jgi:hypothetical protein